MPKEKRLEVIKSLNEAAEKIKPCVEVVDICPEVGMGLGIPRDRLIIVLNGEEKKAHTAR